jgi:hypothetical protein
LLKVEVAVVSEITNLCRNWKGIEREKIRKQRGSTSREDEGTENHRIWNEK